MREWSSTAIVSSGKFHANSRSHVYLAIDSADQSTVAIKIPSIDRRGDAAYLQRFRAEEWIARRINSPHVLKAREPTRTRHYVYLVSEFVEGQTLSQWMTDNPEPSLQVSREVVEQIAKGLQAFHRLEMLHQDLRPDNVMIDRTGTAKIIDFGSTLIAGTADDGLGVARSEIWGPLNILRRSIFWAKADRSDPISSRSASLPISC